MSVKYMPLKPHFYIVKLGCTGVYLFFLIVNQKTQIVAKVLTCTLNQCFELKYQIYQDACNRSFNIYSCKNVFILHGRIFVMYVCNGGIKVHIARKLFLF